MNNGSLILSTILALTLPLSAVGCNRGPESSGQASEESAPSGHAAEGNPHGGAPATPRPLAANELPPGHPPMPGAGGAGGPHAQPPAAEELPEFQPLAGGMTWTAPEPLFAQRPSSAMRAAQYGVRDQSEVLLTVFHFPSREGGGGEVDANIERWVSQISQPDGSPSGDVAQIATREVNGISVTTLDVSGTFGGMGGGSGLPGARFLGAIAEGEDGMVFFKMVGPTAGIGLAADAFEALVASLRRP